MAHLGLKRTKLHQLLQLGREFKGVHPLQGGLFPSFKVSHKVRRITASAIERHLAHMERLETEPLFLAQMKAKARLISSEGLS
jgi:hypothetical protein